MANVVTKTRHIYLLLDVSGSMEAVESEQAVSQLEIARTHLNNFGRRIGEKVNLRSQLLFTVATFSNNFDILLDASEVTPMGFQLPQLSSGGATWFGAALSKTADLILRDYRVRPEESKRQPIILLLTDGQPHGETDEALSKARQKLLGLSGVLSPHVFVFALPPANAEALDGFILGAGECWDNREGMALEKYWDLITELIFQITSSSASSDREIDKAMVREIKENLLAVPGSGIGIYTSSKLRLTDDGVNSAVAIPSTCSQCNGGREKCDGHK